jgi:Phytanoyl-CoA dioxygenase (PhyH)
MTPLDDVGFVRFGTGLEPAVLQSLRGTLFAAGGAGTRCLLDHPAVRSTAIRLREELTAAGLLPAGAAAVQAIAFDKTPGTNWKVSWHQDLLFPFAEAMTGGGFALPCLKDGIPYARPPLEVLEALTAVRLHLDDCDETNGPLRIAPGSHKNGILESGEIRDHLAKFGEITCPAKEGEVLLMKVLALHASSQATLPGHRRVLHLVYYSGAPMAAPWHRAI